MSFEFLEDRLKNWIIDLKQASGTLKAEINLMKKISKILTEIILDIIYF